MVLKLVRSELVSVGRGEPVGEVSPKEMKKVRSMANLKMVLEEMRCILKMNLSSLGKFGRFSR